MATKRYELTNHLGNVMSVITDRRFMQVGWYAVAEVVNATDYFPFGMEMSGRVFDASQSDKYAFGVNTQMESPEILPGHTTAQYWEYDSRIGRRWELDPKPNASWSSYSVFGGNPVLLTDWLGDTTGTPNAQGAKWGGMYDLVADANGATKAVYYGETSSDEVVYRQPSGSTKTINKNGSVFEYITSDQNLANIAMANESFNAQQQIAQQNTQDLLNYFSILGNNGETALMATFVAASLVGAAAGVVAFVPVATTTTFVAEEISGAIVENVTGLPIPVSFSSAGRKIAANTSGATLVRYFPENGGALGNWSSEFLMPGTKIDIFGSGFGRYFSPINTPFVMRALPGNSTGSYSAFTVVKPFEVKSSTIAPAFGKIGLGTQYLSPVSMNTLLKRGIIAPLN